MTRLRYTLPDVLRGVLIYSTGDTVASLILSEFSVFRMIGIMFVGGAIYSLEIPAWFRWIDRSVEHTGTFSQSVKRTLLALLYFNPLWITRHIFFIKLFSGDLGGIGWNLFQLGLYSFLVNIPLVLVANHIIQNVIPFRWRFFSSAVFSALMVIYYAFSEVIFN